MSTFISLQDLKVSQSLGCLKSLRVGFMSHVLNTLVPSLNTSFHKSNRNRLLLFSKNILMLSAAPAQLSLNIYEMHFAVFRTTLKRFLGFSFSDFHL